MIIRAEHSLYRDLPDCPGEWEWWFPIAEFTTPGSTIACPSCGEPVTGQAHTWQCGCGYGCAEAETGPEGPTGGAYGPRPDSMPDEEYFRRQRERLRLLNEKVKAARRAGK